MSNPSSGGGDGIGGFGIGTIIFLVFLYNFIFDDDNKKEVDIKHHEQEKHA